MNKLFIIILLCLGIFLSFGCLETAPSVAISEPTMITIVDINGFTHNIKMSDLNDVSVVGLVVGNVLSWNGTAWVPTDVNITPGGTDTNWVTSWSTFDANMKATYALIIHDHNALYILKSDGNALYALKGDVNTWINQINVVQQFDANKWGLTKLDGNALYALKWDVNKWIGQLDTNWQTSWALLDANLKLTYPTQDTNTFTKCGDNNQFVLGTGFCIPYVAGATYKPTGVFKEEGTDFNNVALNAIKEYDGNYYTIQEASGANPLTIDVNFTGVVSFSSIVMKEQYTGGNGHEIVVEIFKYSTGTWDEYFEITDQAVPVTTYIPIEDSTDHVSGGLVQLRFRHINTGNPTHYFYIDYVWLQSGTTTTTTNIHDALSGRDSPSNHPWALSKIDANGFYYTKADINASFLSKVDANGFYVLKTDINKTPVNTPLVANNFFTAYNSTTGVFSVAQPTWGNLTGFPPNCTAGTYMYGIDGGTVYCSTPYDTNWQTSWSIFDANMRATYALKGSDTNWQTSWGTLDANLKATYLKIGLDTNWVTSWNTFDANLAGTYRLYSVDLNTSQRIQADKNILLGTKVYMYDDGNSLIIGRAA